MDYEKNFIDIALDNGFQKISPFTKKPAPHKSRDNWFGVSVYDPAARFEKGNKEIRLSLQSHFWGRIMPEKYIPAAQKSIRFIKYITLVDAGIFMYESWIGEVPPKELIQEFIK